jgi:cyclopropane-fatty-acyl-phospholipid synthase
MSTIELRRPPAARGHALGGVTDRLLDRALAHLEGGTLAVTLPDGSTRRYGEGPEVRMHVRSRNLLTRVATRGSIGLGESYVAGEWDADDLPALFELLLANADAARRRHPRLHRVVTARPRLNRRNGILRARRNIAYHYDLGNDLFRAFLDETMTYSCAVFERDDEPLADAQRRKLRMVCDSLRLGPDDHVLEIGCGWGSFALTAAGEYGARVTGVTISREQAVLARERVAAAGLSGRVEIVERDYRLLEGRYTKVASIEMLEAIGEDQFETYFATIDRLLDPGGWACVQTILIPDQRYARYRATPDWIERYVFPGCLIPSVEAIQGALTRGSSLSLHGLEEIGPHYAETLRRWRVAFHERIGEVRALGYDDRFERIWDFYLAFCEAGFRTRWLRDAQLVLARSGEGLP